MEHTKKFYFVPPDLLAKLNEKSDYLKQISARLEKDVSSTIAKKDVKSAKLMPADKRAILYSQYLQKYLAHKNKLSSPVSPIVKVSEKDKNKSKSLSISSESDIEKIKNDIYQLQTVFNEKYNELVERLPEYWRKGEEQRHIDVSGIDLPSSSSYQRISTPLPSSLSAIIRTEEDLGRRFSTERDQLAQQQREVREAGRQQGDFEETFISAGEGEAEHSQHTTTTSKRKKKSTPSRQLTKTRKGRTQSIQKLIDSIPVEQAAEIERKLHERVTRSSAPSQSGQGFGFNKWKTYYQHKL